MPIRILIVDDHVLIRSGLRLLLASRPEFELVGEAADGDAARVLLEAKAPDVVFMDLDLPGESGLSLTRRFKALRPATRIIVFTGHTDPRQAQDALDAGASAFLRKTNGAGELMDAMEAVLRGQVYLCSETAAALAQPLPRDGAHPPHAMIPARELQVLQGVARGMRNKEIASELEISVKTVETYRARVMKRTGCGTPAELARYAVREGLARP